MIASEIGLVFAGNDPPETQLGRYLSGKRMLLVLDNFEQLLEGALLAVDLVTSCPDVGILVTSRARLGVHEERVIRVRGLDTPPGDVQAIEAMGYDAVRLFTLRAQRSDPDFRLNETTLPHVLRVCEIVEGAPLGLELAASWVQVLPIEDIVDELAQGLDRLPYRAKDIPDRHANLEAALEQSWNLLDERERDVLRRLAVFEGGFRREAASDVAGATLPILASLVDKSLLRLSPRGRYDGDTTSETSDRVRADLPNAQVAWRHHVAVGDADALYVAANFHLQISEQWGRTREGQVLFESAYAVLDAPDERVQRARAMIKGCLAVNFWRIGRLEDGATHWLETLDILDELGADDAWSAYWMAGQGAGLCLFYLTRFEEGLKAIHRRYVVADEGATSAKGTLLRRRLDGLAGLSCVMVSQASIVAGNLDQARQEAREALERMRRSSPRAAAYPYEPLVTIDDAAGDFVAMEPNAREGLEYAERVGHQIQVPSLQMRLGLALLRLDRITEAHDTIAKALEKADRMGDENYACQARALLGRTLLRLDRNEKAKAILIEAARRSAEVATQYALPEALLGLAKMTAAADGEPLAGRIAASVAGHPSGWASTRQMAAKFCEQLGQGTVETTIDLAGLVPEAIAAVES